MPDVYRVQTGVRTRTQLIVNPDGSTTMVPMSTYASNLKTYQKHIPPTANTAPTVRNMGGNAAAPMSPRSYSPPSANAQYYDKSGFQKSGGGIYNHPDPFRKPPPANPISSPNPDPSGFQPYQNQPGPTYGRTPPRVRPSSPLASGSPARLPNSVISRIPESAAGIGGAAFRGMGGVGGAVGLGLSAKVAIDGTVSQISPPLGEIQKTLDANNPLFWALDPRQSWDRSIFNPWGQLYRKPKPPGQQQPGQPGQPGQQQPGQPGYQQPGQRPPRPGPRPTPRPGKPQPGETPNPLAPWNENPFNPFSPWWQDMPWNNPGSPNSLNPTPGYPNHQFPPGTPGMEEEIPFDPPSNMQPFNFQVRINTATTSYGRTLADAFNGVPSYKLFSNNDTTTKQFFGIPQGLVVRELGNGNFEVKLRMSGVADLLHVGGRSDLSPYSPTLGSTELDSKEVFAERLDKEPLPWPRIEPIPPDEWDPLIDPASPIPQMEPVDNPAYPRNPQPDPQPKPAPQPPNRAPSPPFAPLPFPIPQPFPPGMPTPNSPNPNAPPPANPYQNPTPSPQPDNVPRTPQPFPPLPVPMPPPGSHTKIIYYQPSGGTGSQASPGKSPWKEPEIIQLSNPLPTPAPKKPEPTPKDLQDQITDLGNTIEDRTRRGCQYKEDDLVVANITKFTGVAPITNTPQFTVVPMQVHEKLKDYIEFQSETLAKIQGQADGLRGRVQKVLDRLQIIRILNIMGNIASLHNAAMLSRNLGQTLGDATSTTITAIGRMTGLMSAEESIDVNEIVGKAFNEFMKESLGEEVWNGTKANWNKANRILSAASAIVYNIRSIADSARSIAEMTANNVGFIGNALKKWGVVAENEYPYMSTNVDSRTAFQVKMDKVRQGIENLDDATSSISSVAGEVVSIQDEFNQTTENLERLKKSMEENPPKVTPDNKPVKDAVTASKNNSQGKELDSVAIAISGEEE